MPRLNLTAIAFFCCSCVVLMAKEPPARPTPVKFKHMDEWSGQTSKKNFDKLPSTAIVNAMDWAHAWQTLNPNSKLPKVDFTRDIVFITSQDANDPNSMRVNFLRDKDGTLQNLSITTLIGFPPSDQRKYSMYLVSREGITAVKVYDPMQKKMVAKPLK